MNSIKSKITMVLSLGFFFLADPFHPGLAEPPISPGKYGRNRYDAGAESLAPLEVWLFTAEDSVAANRGTLIVIGLRNNTHDLVSLSNDIVVQPLHDDVVPSTRPTTLPPTTHESTSKPTNLYAIVFVKGKYQNQGFGIGAVMSLHYAAVPLAYGHIEYFPTSVVGGFMQTGTYELQVIVYDGKSAVARSAIRKITIDPG